MTESSFFASVDRIETSYVVLVGDDAKRYEVRQEELPRGLVEGNVLRVPRDAGKPFWPASVVDAAEERSRREVRKTLLKKLGKRDPGGDLNL